MPKTPIRLPFSQLPEAIRERFITMTQTDSQLKILHEKPTGLSIITGGSIILGAFGIWALWGDEFGEVEMAG